MATTTSPSELLTTLRGDRTDRPAIDPMLAGGLRAWLEDELADLAGDLPAHHHLRLPARQIAQSDAACDPEGEQAALSVLVHALVAQHIVFGQVADPLADAVDALAASGAHGPLLERIAALDDEASTVLAGELAAHDLVLSGSIGRIPASWLPRSDVPIAVDLCGGRIRASAKVDLVLGAPAGTVASRCLVDVVATPLGGHHADQLGALALIETLRTGAAPLRVATLSTATGEHLVLAVDDALLTSSLRRLVDAARRLARAVELEDVDRPVTRIHA